MSFSLLREKRKNPLAANDISSHWRLRCHNLWGNCWKICNLFSFNANLVFISEEFTRANKLWASFGFKVFEGNRTNRPGRRTAKKFATLSLTSLPRKCEIYKSLYAAISIWTLKRIDLSLERDSKRKPVCIISFLYIERQQNFHVMIMALSVPTLSHPFEANCRNICRHVRWPHIFSGLSHYNKHALMQIVPGSRSQADINPLAVIGMSF